MDFIKELFWGNVCPTDFLDSAITKNPEYKKSQKDFSKVYSEIEKNLSEDMLKLFDEAMELHTRTFTVQDEETFKIGFIIGARLMCACFCENNEIVN